MPMLKMVQALIYLALRDIRKAYLPFCNANSFDAISCGPNPCSDKTLTIRLQEVLP